MTKWQERHLVPPSEQAVRIQPKILIDKDKLRVAYLRAAYLAAFSWIGYIYAWNRALDIVRNQILDPSKQLIPAEESIIEPEGQSIFSRDKAVFVIEKPLDAIGVAFPPYLVLLPFFNDDGTFYERVRTYQTVTKRGAYRLEGRPLGWPTTLPLHLDFAKLINPSVPPTA